MMRRRVRGKRAIRVAMASTGLLIAVLVGAGPEANITMGLGPADCAAESGCEPQPEWLCFAAPKPQERCPSDDDICKILEE